MPEQDKTCRSPANNAQIPTISVAIRRCAPNGFLRKLSPQFPCHSWHFEPPARTEAVVPDSLMYRCNVRLLVRLTVLAVLMLLPSLAAADPLEGVAAAIPYLIGYALVVLLIGAGIIIGCTSSFVRHRSRQREA